MAMKGEYFTYVYTKGANRGIAVVTIDGAEVDHLDTYSSTTQWQQNKTYYLGQGYHMIRITPSGTKNSSATDYYIDIDALQVDRWHAYLNVNGSVVNGPAGLEMRYGEINTIFQTEIASAANNWNQLGKVQIISPPPSAGYYTVTIYDYNDCNDEAAGRYYDYGTLTDNILLNRCFMDSPPYNSTVRRKVIQHEFGHALQLDHSADDDQIMYSTPINTTQINLGWHDKQGYYVLYP